MLIELKLILPQEAAQLLAMQRAAFMPLLEKYHDDATSPACESQQRVLARITQPGSFYYWIALNQTRIGAVRVLDRKNGERKKISPIFILPQYQNRGYAQQVFALLESAHGQSNWGLATIEQETRCCYLYEKLGYTRTGERTAVNSRMTIVGYVKG